MLSIRARNVNDAIAMGMTHLHHGGAPQACRSNIGGSSTLEFPTCVATTYENPRERVLWHPVRDANPFFHFFEALWIIAGRNDVEFLQQFNKRIADVSDDGAVFHGAYGHRLRHMRDFDQIEHCINLLRADPDTRRAVLQIWDARYDLGNTASKDLPCNDMVMLKVREGALNIMVCNRSNDIVWGKYGANVVQFSMLQEYMAARLGVNVGRYTHVTDSFHVYDTNPFWQAFMHAIGDGADPMRWFGKDPYCDAVGEVYPYPLFEEAASGAFDRDLAAFFARGLMVHHYYETTAFNEVVIPLYRVHRAYREGDFTAAMTILVNCAPCDWRVACGMWLARRTAKAKQRIIVPGQA